MTPTTPVVQANSMKQFVGKTIKSINDKYVNQIEITFTDGSEVRLEAEGGDMGLWVAKYVPRKD